MIHSQCLCHFESQSGWRVGEGLYENNDNNIFSQEKLHLSAIIIIMEFDPIKEFILNIIIEV